MRIRPAIWTTALLLALSRVAWCQEPAPDSGKSIPELVQLNLVALFGPHAELKEGRVTLRFPPDGSFAASFVSRSTPQRGFVANPEHRNTVTVRQVLHEVDKQAACAAIQSGSALSRFELAEDIKLRFKVKAPSAGRTSTVSLRVNAGGPKSFIEITNFQMISVLGGKRSIREMTKLPEYQGHWSSWFDRKSQHGVEFQVVFKDGKLSVSTFLPKEGDKESPPLEIVAVDGIEAPRGGRIMWTFNNLSFALTDLVIEGNYSTEWATTELANLKKNGQLRVEEPQVAAGAETPEKEPAPAASANDRKDSAKGRDVDLETPDPEADEDL